MCIVLSLVHWVFFVIFFEHVLVECAILDIYHGGPYAASSATQTSRYSEATVVFASHRGNLFASSATTPDLYHTPRSSFERHPLFEENRRHHGDQHPMAMCQLQAVEEKIGHPLPNLSSTMASGFGHNIYVHQHGGTQAPQETYTPNWAYDQQGWSGHQDQAGWNRQRSKSRTQTPRKGRRSKSAKSPKRNPPGDGTSPPPMVYPPTACGKGQVKGQAPPLPPPTVPWPGYGNAGPPMMMMPPAMQMIPCQCPCHHRLHRSRWLQWLRPLWHPHPPSQPWIQSRRTSWKWQGQDRWSFLQTCVRRFRGLPRRRVSKPQRTSTPR